MPRGNKTFYLACVLGLLLTACAKKDPPAFERPPSPVTIATAVPQDVPLKDAYPPWYVEMMPTPGAASVTEVGPKFEKPAM